MPNDVIVDKLGVEILERVANMEISDVPMSQICIANGISIEELVELRATEEYNNIKEKAAVENFLWNKDLNDGWDAVEKMAVSTIITTLQYSKDPDYAMRAAMVANKAQRKGSHENIPVEARSGGVAVINLQQTFVNKLQNNHVSIAPRTGIEKEVPQKQQDFLPVEKVEKMFAPVGLDDKDGAIDVKSLEEILIDAVG